MPFSSFQIPLITIEQMKKIDKLAVDQYKIGLIQMMENAGRNLVDMLRRFDQGSLQNKCVAVVVGTGNNGGGGLVAARHLINTGACITVLIPRKLKSPTAQRQLEILEAFGITPVWGEKCVDKLRKTCFDFIIDALIGYGLIGRVRPLEAKLIQAINENQASVISLDVPSGLNADSGKMMGVAVKADVTMTLALPKIGLMQPHAVPCVGKLFLADISIPVKLYRQLGIEMGNIFGKEALIHLGDEPVPLLKSNCSGYIFG